MIVVNSTDTHIYDVFIIQQLNKLPIVKIKPPYALNAVISYASFDQIFKYKLGKKTCLKILPNT